MNPWMLSASLLQSGVALRERLLCKLALRDVRHRPVDDRHPALLLVPLRPAAQREPSERVGTADICPAFASPRIAARESKSPESSPSAPHGPRGEWSGGAIRVCRHHPGTARKRSRSCPTGSPVRPFRLPPPGDRRQRPWSARRRSCGAFRSCASASSASAAFRQEEEHGAHVEVVGKGNRTDGDSHGFGQRADHRMKARPAAAG